jgi:hypothetical protein
MHWETHMTTIVQTTDGSGTIFLIDNLNTYVLAPGVTHVGRIDLDQASTGRTFVQISGHLINTSLIANFDSTTAAVTFAVTSTGLVSAASPSNALDLGFAGRDAVLTNSGTILLDNIQFSGADFNIINTGLVSEAPISNILNDGLFFIFGASGTINNSGTIAAVADAFSFSGVDPNVSTKVINTGNITSGVIAIDTVHEINIQNSGTISGDLHAIDADEDFVLLNSGTLSAFGDAVSFGSDGRVTNTGTITSDARGLVAGGSTYIQNAGIISGSTAGINTGFGSTVLNDGDILADFDAIVLGSGSTVTNDGTITGLRDGIFGAGATNITNSGKIQGGTEGLDINGVLTLSNSGEIASSQGVAIDAASGFNIKSSGIITALTNLIASDAATGQTVTLNNSGTMQGGGAIIETGFANIRLTNSGTIDSLTGLNTAGFVRLVNDGNILLGGDFVDAGGYLLRNTDTITATGNGVTSSGGFRNTFNNQGMFIADQTALADAGSFSLITNSGTVIGSTAMDLSGVGYVINNSGMIQSLGNAFLGPVAAITMDNTAGYIVRNSGEIDGLSNGIDATLATGEHLFINTGTITGINRSIYVTNDLASSAFGHEVNNRGLLVGDVVMSEGDDLYYGKWGAIEGDILMGGGNDTASGGAEDERIEGGDGNDDIFGFGGDDNLQGDAGNDKLRGGDGDDVLNGGDNNDDLWGNDGDDVLFGGDGNDLLRGDDGADVLNGGSGYDRASYRDASEAIVLDLLDPGASTGAAAGDSYVSIEVFEATNFNDIMNGSNVRDVLRGFDGDDVISGNGGNDLLQGYEGDDTFTGGSGNDAIDGGNGRDVANFSGDLSDYTITMLMDGRIRVEDNVGSDGNDGIDTLTSIEFVTFGGGAEIDVMGLI